MRSKCKFKKGDRVVLNGCPFDEQIATELLDYIKVQGVVQTVKAVSDMYKEDPDGSWQIKTDQMDWTAEEWFDKAKK